MIADMRIVAALLLCAGLAPATEWKQRYLA